MYLRVILILNVILFFLLIVCVSVWKSDSPSSVFPESGGGERGSPGRLSLGDGESLSMSPNSGGVGAGGGSPGSLKVPGAGPSTGGLGRIARLLVKDTSRGGEESYRRRTHSLERYASQSLHTHIHTHGQSVTHSLTYIITLTRHQWLTRTFIWHHNSPNPSIVIVYEYISLHIIIY